MTVARAPAATATVFAMASLTTLLFKSLLFLVYGLPVSWAQCHNSTALAIQMDALLAEYDREEPPPSAGLGIIVHVTLDIRHATIDQEHSTMRLLTDLKMTWEDRRVSWNQTEWGCDYAITAAERLWLPDIVLLNTAATGGSNAPSEVGLRARLDFVGAVTWVMRLDLTTPVAMDLYKWPRDTQSCDFKFASRAFTFDEIELQITDLKRAVVFESGPWEINSMSGDTTVWQRGEERISLATWTVEVTRRAPAHAVAATTVLVATALMLVAAVALPPDQRHALAACTSFTTALWLITALLRLPGASSCPRVMSVMCCVCVSGAACSACAALVRRVARCSAPPPRLLRTALSSLSNVCRLTPSPEECSTSESGAWAAASVLADRVLCGALLLTVAVLLAVHVS